MYKYLFFDADGTLFNFKKSEKIALENAIRQEAGIWRDEFFPAYHEINDRLWKKAERKEITLEKLRPERFEILKKRFGLEYDSNRMSDAYIDCLSKSTDMLPGAIEILEKYSRTHTLVLMTNGLSKVQRGRLHGTDTAKYFKLVVISAETRCTLFPVCIRCAWKPSSRRDSYDRRQPYIRHTGSQERTYRQLPDRTLRRWCRYHPKTGLYHFKNR